MRPNIVIFMTDQQQADVVHPDHPCQTPNATRLIEDGLMFSRAYCPTAHCCPSRASFMTGLYPSRHGVYNNVSTPTAINRSLRAGVTTFSEILRAAGYRLAFAGKWHVSQTEGPADRGWDEITVHAGTDSVMQRSVSEWRDMARRYDLSDGTRLRHPGEIDRPGWNNFRLFGKVPDVSAVPGAPTDDRTLVDASIAAMQQLAGQTDPWCLFIGTYGPHDSYFVPERYVERYSIEDVPLPASYGDDLSDKPRIYQRMRQQVWSQLSDYEVRDAIRHYWAYCTYIDELLGDVLDALDRTGSTDNTLVVQTSDHGDYAGAHGLFLKGVPAFREAYRVPAIARWPRGILNPGRTVDSFVTLADFAPTFIETAGERVPERLTGRSLAPFFVDDRPIDWPDAVFSQFNGVELYYTQRAVETVDYRYVYNGFDFDELYDLRADPLETVNLSAIATYDDIKRELVARMWRFAAENEDELIFNDYGTVALAPWGPTSAWTGRSNPRTMPSSPLH